MTVEEKDKIGLIILDTLEEYLTEKEIQGDVIIESQFDDIADDLINKLFIHNVRLCFSDYKENLLLKAEQYEREQEYFVDNAPEDLEYNKAVLTGVTRIVSLIRRFNKA